MSHLGSEAVYNSSRVCNLQLLVLEVFLDTIRMISVNIVVLILRIIMYSKLQTCSKLIIISEVIINANHILTIKKIWQGHLYYRYWFKNFNGSG